MTATVVLVANHGRLGGGEVMLLESARVLLSLGVHPVVVAPSAPSDVADEARALGAAVVTYVPQPGAVVRSLRRARRAVIGARADHPGALIWCHGLAAALATTGLRSRVVQLHRVPDPQQIPAVLLACRGAVDLVVPSADTRARLAPPLRKHCHVLQNWTAHMTCTARSPRGSADPVRVGFLGRPAEGKGVSDLALAVSRVQSTNSEFSIALRIAGEPHFVAPSEQDAVERALAALGSGVERVGWVDREAFLRDIDILVCPSWWAESFGLVAAEAMAAGTPVVVSDAGALPEVVGKQHPYVAAAGDVVALARAIALACADLDSARGQAVIDAAHQRWREWWSPEAGRQRVRKALKRWEVRP